MNRLPKNWKEVTLAEICLNKGEYGSGASAVEYSKNKPRYVRITDIDENNNLKKDSVVSPSFIEENLFLENDDLLFARSGSVGRTYLHKEKGEFQFAGYLIRFKPNKKIVMPQYLFYYTKTPMYESWIKAKAESKKMTMANINAKEYASMKIPLPPLDVQKDIISVLEKAEKIKEKRKEANELSEKYLQNLLLKSFKNHKLENFDKNSIEIIDGDRGVNYPKQKDFFEKGYCLFLNTKNVRYNGFNFNEKMFISNEKDKAMGKGKLQRNDVVLTTRGTVGNVAYYDKSVQFENIRINSGMVLLRANPKSILPHFLFYLIQMPLVQNQFKKMNSGSAQPQLPIFNLKRVSILVPSIDEQKKFIKEAQKIETLKQIQNMVTINVENLFSSLVQKAFKGDL
jgi:restriction endonuclease S subunit